MGISGLIKKQKEFYKNIKRVYSPALKDYVYFKSNGFQHIFYRSNRKPRNKEEVSNRSELLSFVPEAVLKCKKVVEERFFPSNSEKRY